jgi:hypothetical protein
MQSFQRGFTFLKQAWQIALADPDLLKPSFFALFAGFLVTVLLLIPFGGAFLLLNDTSIGQPILYVLGALMIFTQLATGYIFSAMTVYLIYGYLAEGDGVMSKAWAIVRRDFWDILSLAVASTLVNLLRSFLEKKGRRVGGGVLSSILGAVWTEAAYLVLPVMVIEDVNLAQGLKRVGEIVKKNLLLIGVSTVGVGAVTGLIGFLLSAVGIALGFGVGLGLVSLAGDFVPGIVGGISLGVLIASLFIMVATVIGSYTTTAYHTCLYLWARDAEKAQESGQPLNQVNAPAPLAAVITPTVLQ